MQPLEPGLSFIAQRYLNHIDNYLTRLISHFRHREELHRTARFYYDTLANNLEKFQESVPPERRAVLSLIEQERDYLLLQSVYRQTPDFKAPVLATVEFDRFPDAAKSKSCSVGDPVILRKTLEENPQLSLTCLLKPVLGLMEDLRKAGWVTTIDCRAGKTIMTVMTDRNVAVYFATMLDELEADTAAIKAYHASKGHP